MPIDHALFAGVVASIAAAPAGAQQTPAAYCKTLAPASCEVLNVEPIGLGFATLSGNNPFQWAISAFLIKQCRNQNFETRIVEFSNGGGGAFSGVVPGLVISEINASGIPQSHSAAGMFEGRTTIGSYPVTDLALGCF